MAELIAKTPFDGLLPLTIGTLVVTEADPGPITLVQPLRDARSRAALERALGGGLPGPGEAVARAAGRCLWCGPERALVLGAGVETEAAALIDQSDAWAVARIEGPDSREVLARLTPLDVRRSAFSEGRTARTLLGHMTAQITPVGPEGFEVMVFRSMAETLVHDLSRAMGFVAGRGAIG